jgi:hypothetical protein
LNREQNEKAKKSKKKYLQLFTIGEIIPKKSMDFLTSIQPTVYYCYWPILLTLTLEDEDDDDDVVLYEMASVLPPFFFLNGILPAVVVLGSCLAGLAVAVLGSPSLVGGCWPSPVVRGWISNKSIEPSKEIGGLSELNLTVLLELFRDFSSMGSRPPTLHGDWLRSVAASGLQTLLSVWQWDTVGP